MAASQVPGGAAAFVADAVGGYLVARHSPVAFPHEGPVLYVAAIELREIMPV